jgi:hypothetical protein
VTVGERSSIGRVARDAGLTLLFAVIAVVSAVGLVKTAVRPFEAGSYGIAQWALFAVTLVGSTLAFVRSIRFYASLSLLTALRPRSEEGTESSDPPKAESTLHPVLDDLSWAAIALAVAAINALAVWAVLATLDALFGGSSTPTGWLLWQLALLTAALTTLVRFAEAVVAELRDRSRRRRRNLVHIITGKLVSWPGDAPGKSGSGRWKGRAATAAAAAALAAASWASASGPLLDPEPPGNGPPAAGVQAGVRLEQGGSGTAGAMGGAPAAGAGAPAPGATGPPAGLGARPTRPQTAPPRGEAAPRRGRSARARQRSRGASDSAGAPPAVAPAPPTPPTLSPPPASVAPADPPGTAPPRAKRRRRDTRDDRWRRRDTRDDRRDKRRPRQREDRARRTPPTSPVPSPAPPSTPTVPAPVPAPPPATPPVPTIPEPEPPCDPNGFPTEPPCEPPPPTPPPNGTSPMSRPDRR